MPSCREVEGDEEMNEEDAVPDRLPWLTAQSLSRRPHV